MIETKPWGYYEVLYSSEKYQVKKLYVEPKNRISYQRHKHRSEHWFIVSGCPLVTLNGHPQVMAPGQSIDIPVGVSHRLEAGNLAVELIEVQTGDFLDEGDIERLEDDYGRN